MPVIHLTTFIEAPAQRVFDLSRSISLHTISMNHTNETAIAGITSGLINLNETVTWEAKHLLKKRKLQSKITEMDAPVKFVDEMLTGDFKELKHEHHFKQVANGTIMIDLLTFSTPYGVLGKVVNKLLLERYMKRLLQQRNQVIKAYAETSKWKTVLL